MTVFDVTPESDGEGIELHGTVSTPRLELKAREEVARATGRETSGELTVLEPLRTESRHAAVAPVLGDADDDASR